MKCDAKIVARSGHCRDIHNVLCADEQAPLSEDMMHKMIMDGDGIVIHCIGTYLLFY